MTQLPSLKVGYLFLIGLDDPGAFLRDDAIRAGMGALDFPHVMLMDSQSLAEMGPTVPGTRVAINGENLTVAGQFKLGLFFYGEGSGIVRNADFTRLAGRPPNSITMGLIRLAPGADPAEVKARLMRTLPSDTLVLTRGELIAQERDYFLSTKPVGIMMVISMLIAYLVGSVILIQILSTDLSNRMGEYAVLKAMGFAAPFVYGVGAAEAALLSLGGLIPALGPGRAGALDHPGPDPSSHRSGVRVDRNHAGDRNGPGGRGRGGGPAPPGARRSGGVVLMAFRLGKFHLDHRPGLGLRLLSHNRLRLLLAAASIAFGVVVMLVEIGLLTGILDSQALIATLVRGDLVVMNAARVDLHRWNTIDTIRLSQIAALPDIARVIPVYEGHVGLKSPDDARVRRIIVYAMPPDEMPLAIGDADTAARLKFSHGFLFDTAVAPDLRPCPARPGDRDRQCAPARQRHGGDRPRYRQ